MDEETSIKLQKENRALKKILYLKCKDCAGDDVREAALCNVASCPINFIRRDIIQLFLRKGRTIKDLIKGIK